MNPTDPTPLPCPFCGLPPSIRKISFGVYVLCQSRTCPAARREILLEKWNTRAPSAELAQAQAELADLERAANALRDALCPIAELIGPEELPALPPSLEVWIRADDFRSVYAALARFDALKEKTQ